MEHCLYSNRLIHSFHSFTNTCCALAVYRAHWSWFTKWIQFLATGEKCILGTNHVLENRLSRKKKKKSLLFTFTKLHDLSTLSTRDFKVLVWSYWTGTGAGHTAWLWWAPIHHSLDQRLVVMWKCTLETGERPPEQHWTFLAINPREPSVPSPSGDPQTWCQVQHCWKASSGFPRGSDTGRIITRAGTWKRTSRSTGTDISPCNSALMPAIPTSLLNDHCFQGEGVAGGAPGM